MRRSARALSVAVLAGAALGLTGPVAFAEPAAEVSPGSVSPGGSVTVSVSCDPTGGTPPATLDATSQAFDTGGAKLQLVPGNDDDVSGPAYSGTARIAAAAQPLEDAADEADAAARDSAWTVDGTCPAAPGGQSKQWSATFTVHRGSGGHCTQERGSSCPTTRPCTDAHTAPHDASCSGAAVQRGVRAGEGGAFTDSVPALVAGGLLIAGALGAAVHRLRRREPGRADG
ncbi:secreted protein [Streptomyces lincolnensis]|uniref:Secreted protein n=1 Tax=Streptomyces lincolnensis TaxID=1915 RepID=A0A1B1MKL8_STRLN|nr:hypothetical protein [Streptomyces lincolnensis]ANS69165.1 secreted protein [Streptomyces lincolnensis]AXG58084.1 secreted protein [Streptomyces lincolnensis]QMV10748.1 hypothetical protein GJU35_37145 [Streptomyces lincolnensis]